MRCLMASPWSLMSMSRILPVPDVGWTRPIRTLMRVDLPAPFGPRRPVAPVGICRDTESRAITVSYCLRIFLVLMMHSSHLSFFFLFLVTTRSLDPT